MVTLNSPRVLAAIAIALFACSTPIRTQTLVHLGATPLSKLALVAAEATPRLTGEGGVERDLATQIVTGRVLKALNDLRSFEVVPPSEVAAVLGSSPGLDPLAGNLRLNGTFGVQGVLRLWVSRFQQRQGGPRGVSRPAAVSFTLELSGADGLIIWRGTYEEIQQSLSDDPGSLSRARARKFRWVTAETLANYGARELVLEIPGPGASWK